MASLTLLPVFAPEGRRGVWSLGGFTFSLLLLLLVCCIYTGESWFPIAAVSVLFGMGLVFLPFVLRALPLPEELADRKALLYVVGELVLLLLLFGVCCLSFGENWFLSASIWTVFGLGIPLLPPLLKEIPLPQSWQRHKALVYFSFETILLLLGLAWEGRYGDFPFPMLPIALCCLLLPWGWLGAVRYLPFHRWIRLGTGFGWTALWIWLSPWALDRVLLLGGWISSHPYELIIPFDFTNWTDPSILSANVIMLILLGFVLLAAVCIVLGLKKHRRPTRS